MTGADLLCRVLRQLDVSVVFGLPGTQNVRLYEALRANGMRSVVPADEGSAAFMAAGYARASGRVGVLTTIPGPGFVYALPGIVEARHDSAPVLWITLRQADLGRAFQLQRIDQAALAAPVVKRCLHVGRIEQLTPTLVQAHALARDGEPGPVLLEIDASLLEVEAAADAPSDRVSAPPADLQALAGLLSQARRPVIYVGQGAQAASSAVRILAARLNAPVLCTSSGRGVMPDTDPLAFVRDFSTGPGEVIPELIERADLVLALGCKFTHNGSAGGQLQLPQDKLLRVDTSAEVLAANYPARLALVARVEDVLAGLAAAPLDASQWSVAELADARHRLQSENSTPLPFEPRLPDTTGVTMRTFFAALSEAFGGDTVYVTDAGLHQAMTRRYSIVNRPRGLLCPSDFQSMGFGLPGAIGAAVAQPQATVIACIGDAGFVLSMGDLTTAAREGIDLVVVVFNDGQMNLIRRQQLANYGRESGVAVTNPDFAQLAGAIGCSYFRMSGDARAVAAQVASIGGLRLVELRLADDPSLDWQAVRSVIREGIGELVPDGTLRRIKRLLVR